MDEREAVGQVVRRLVDAWNRSDADGFASLFMPSAEYRAGSGRTVRGRAEIGELVRQAAPGSQVALVGPDRTEVTEGIATTRFRWLAVANVGENRRGTIECRLVYQGGSWLIEALHNDEEGTGRPSPPAGPTKPSQGA